MVLLVLWQLYIPIKWKKGKGHKEKKKIKYMVGGEDLKAENYSLNSNDTVCVLWQLKKFLAECLSIPLSEFGLQINICAIQTYINNFNGAIYIVNQYGATQ